MTSSNPHPRGDSPARAALLLALLQPAMLPLAGAQPAVEALAEYSLRELAEVEVISVSKATEPLRAAAASIYVITQDEILRSGVTSVVEALRLAPNLLVSQYNGTYYVAGARGLGGAQEAQNFSNKLLILIDGRSVYSPLYSGVYLDVQDVVIEDIERIEVISGPGATLWGANAMHGVINIITRPAYLTDTLLASVGYGNVERVASLRYGARASPSLAWRAYAKAFDREPTRLVDGSSGRDDWHKAQIGFRLDGTFEGDSATLQGDVYRGDQDLSKPGANTRVEGGNVLGRWQRTTGDSDWQVQAYYDFTARGAPAAGVAFDLHTLDLELQNRRRFEGHRVIWGAGLRVHDYGIRNSVPLAFQPAERTLTLANLFLQDSIALTPGLDLTVGLKGERDSFSGWNMLPDVRLAWRPSEHALLWGAASRAIRSPTPFDRDVVERVDGVDFLVGNPGFEPERVDTFEVGVRGQPSEGFTYSASAFYNVYDDLRTIEPGPAVLPLRWDNLIEGESYGLEVWARWQVTDWWRLSPAVRLLEKELEFSTGASRLVGLWQAGNDPSGQALLTSSMDVGPDVTLDLTLRHVAALPEPRLPAYEELNVSVGWRASEVLELRLSGLNLLDSQHLEYPAPSGNYVRRAVLLQARWRN